MATDQDKIIAAAKEAGIQVIFDGKFGRDDYQSAFGSFPALERFYAIAFEAGRQAEREECAKLCESTYPEYGGANPYCFETPSECAEAIRARGDNK